MILVSPVLGGHAATAFDAYMNPISAPPLIVAETILRVPLTGRLLHSQRIGTIFHL